MCLWEFEFVKKKEYDFKNKIRLIKRDVYTGKVWDCLDEYMSKNNDEEYVVSEYLLDALVDGVIVECIGCWHELIGAPKPERIVETTTVYANCPLWTTFYSAWIFKHYYALQTIYLAYIVSPRISSSINHTVSRYPIVLNSLDDEEIREKLKIRELKEGHCLFCGAELPEEPEYYEYGLGHRGEPNVPVYICPNCGRKNYGFRLGEFVKDVYT